MKKLLKLIGAPVIVAVVLATTPATSRAEEYRHRPPPQNHRNNDGAAIAVFAGIATIGLIAALASHNDRHYDRYDRGYCPPPPPPQRWVPGHYETRNERVCIPGYWDTVTVPAEYGWVRHGCRQVWVQIKPECTRRVWVPERYEWRETRVWVPGRMEVCRAY
jgi:hypothetical protein